MDKTDMIVTNKASHFNNNMVLSNCSICNKKTEEVHHIEEQHLANQDGMIDYFNKNNLFNLVQLCHDCHQKVHHDKIKINGYISTSEGVKLDYKYIDTESDTILVSNKRKYSKDQIDIIKNIHDKIKVLSTTKKILEKDHDLKVSTPIIKKISSGTY